MTNTNHFNLNKPEGSDLYNHLTIDNPNMDIIDAAMYDNEIHSVGDAAELKSGSVHSITRMNGDTSVFKFTATSDFVAGETFTLDGEQVTVYTTDAQPLPTNAYRIGATVLCAVSGSVITMYVQAAPSVAQDSEKLGGQLPEYYGKASDVTSAVQTAQAAATVANQANQTANNVNNALTAFKTYSSTEQVIGLWTDNKPLYRQVITIDNPNVSYTYNHNIPIDKVTKIDGYSFNNSAYITIPCGVVMPDGMRFYLYADRTAINVYDSFSTYDTVYVILEYTKTTD